jgi:hypothetical protein
VQHREKSKFWNPTCVIGGNKKNYAKSDSSAFRDPKDGKSAYFTHPDFSAAKLDKKSAQITRVNAIIQNVDRGVLNTVFKNTVRHVGKCLETGGGHFEHYL